MVYILLGDGFETNEALTCINYLRRASIETFSLGLGKKYAVSSQKIKVECDGILEETDLSDARAVILPGGLAGVENIRNNKKAQKTILEMNEKKTLICAICAAPTLLAEMGLLEGVKAVCYPEMNNIMTENGVIYDTNARTIKDKNFITSVAAGSSEEFAFAIIEEIAGKNAAEKVKNSVYSKAF